MLHGKNIEYCKMCKIDKRNNSIFKRRCRDFRLDCIVHFVFLSNIQLDYSNGTCFEFWIIHILLVDFHWFAKKACHLNKSHTHTSGDGMDHRWMSKTRSYLRQDGKYKSASLYWNTYILNRVGFSTNFAFRKGIFGKLAYLRAKFQGAIYSLYATSQAVQTVNGQNRTKNLRSFRILLESIFSADIFANWIKRIESFHRKHWQ